MGVARMLSALAKTAPPVSVMIAFRTLIKRPARKSGVDGRLEGHAVKQAMTDR